MLSNKIFAKLLFFAVATLLLTGFNLCIVIHCRTSSILSFFIGGLTFSVWFSLLELITLYLEERRHEKFR